MLGVRSHLYADGKAATTAGPTPAHHMPRWVKIFGILAALAIAVFADLHHGGGMEHLTHGGMAQHLP
jgi:hypothetical protein